MKKPTELEYFLKVIFEFHKYDLKFVIFVLYLGLIDQTIFLFINFLLVRRLKGEHSQKLAKKKFKFFKFFLYCKMLHIIYI